LRNGSSPRMTISRTLPTTKTYFKRRVLNGVVILYRFIINNNSSQQFKHPGLSQNRSSNQPRTQWPNIQHKLNEELSHTGRVDQFAQSVAYDCDGVLTPLHQVFVLRTSIAPLPPLSPLFDQNP
jgi:hypothetical protein